MFLKADQACAAFRGERGWHLLLIEKNHPIHFRMILAAFPLHGAQAYPDLIYSVLL